MNSVLTLVSKPQLGYAFSGLQIRDFAAGGDSHFRGNDRKME